MGIKLLAFGLISIFCNQFVHANFCYNDVISGCSSIGKSQKIFTLYLFILFMFV